MTDTHCPGFESNKTLSSCNVKCPECGKEWEIFSDEVDKSAKCPACGASVDAKANCVKS
jgi:ribosomal protein S27E